MHVRVVSASSALFSERPTLAGALLALPFLTRVAGEARLENGHLRVVVHASALSVLAVGGLAGVLVLGGLQPFLGRPGLGTALVAGALVGLGAWLLLQISKVGRDVTDDAVAVLGMMARHRPGDFDDAAARAEEASYEDVPPPGAGP